MIHFLKLTPMRKRRDFALLNLLISQIFDCTLSLMLSGSWNTCLLRVFGDKTLFVLVKYEEFLSPHTTRNRPIQ